MLCIGISPCESEASDVQASTLADTPRASDCADDDSTNSSVGTPSCSEVGSCPTQSHNNSLTDEQRPKTLEKSPTRAGLPMSVGLDDLLQGITMDQMSELIHALNSESSLDSVGVKLEPTCGAEPAVEVIRLCSLLGIVLPSTSIHLFPLKH